MRWIYAIEQRRFFAYEQQIARTFSHALVCTAVEQREFERLIPGVPVSLVGNGVDLDYFRPGGHPKQPGSIVFTGVMDYLPNIDAVTWFCNETLPLIQAQIPEASFVICGSRPTAAVRRLAKKRGITRYRTGCGHAALSRSGGSVCGAFTNGARHSEQAARGVGHGAALRRLRCGLERHSRSEWRGNTPGRNDPKEFAGHVVRLLREGDFRIAMARKARAAAEANYRWGTQLAVLDRVIAGLSPRQAPLVSLERA